MSEIATPEKLEVYLAQVSTADPAPTRPASLETLRVNTNSGQGSQLELFFREMKYPRFVEKQTPRLSARYRKASSSNSNAGALKFNLRLH